eukprot:TRINITY_DN8135_c2_g1_i1.p2 TRINITY_DN8135_c2_g1~~TRINITY_DN8135_c2_g1_i1.p2  ORF type:complete len:102 (-),score=19.12 TRINITY_DN8135_c2_g1_i1:44-349(-)
MRHRHCTMMAKAGMNMCMLPTTEKDVCLGPIVMQERVATMNTATLMMKSKRLSLRSFPFSRPSIEMMRSKHCIVQAMCEYGWDQGFAKHAQAPGALATPTP